MRRFLGATAAIVVYAIISSVVVAMAQGYTWDVDTRQMIVTGILEVNTFPTNAKVTVNTELSSQNTPFSMAYPAGVYHTEVEHQGYQPWSFSLPVKSQLRTQVTELPFFPNQNNWERAVTEPVDSLHLIAESDKLLGQTAGGRVHIWQLKKDGLEELFTAVFTGDVAYSCDDAALICVLADSQSAYLLNLTTLQLRPINGMPLLYGQHRLVNFRNQYYLFARVANDVILQKLNEDGSLTSHQFLDGVESFALSGFEIAYTRDSAVWIQSIIGGEPEKLFDLGLTNQVVTAMDIGPTLLTVKTNDGQILVWNRYTHQLLGQWQHASYQPLGARLAIISDAKLWISTADASAMVFMGQMAQSIQSLQSYSRFSWLVTLDGGKKVLVNENPVLQQLLETEADHIVSIPYLGVVALQNHQLQYHLFPQGSWFKAASTVK
ncbi:PEGA domain-containing protein [Candidatus Gracilibacteria bacterium]|nr:PEGA domain-containing protein [Candidatus Gracilibacteria bacterium]